MGVPAHPLMIHAAVVFVPLLAVMTIAYAFAPFLRPHIRVVLGLLALATPGAALLAKLSGDAFFRRMQSRGTVTAEFIPTIQAHQRLGTLTLYATIGLAVVTLALVYYVGPRLAAARTGGGTEPSRVVTLVLGALSLVAAGISVYYVFRTGDSGAKAVWSGL